MKRIEYGAFYGCSNLTAINIPAKVSKIGNRVFYGCGNLNSVEWNGNTYSSYADFANAAANDIVFVQN